MTVPGALSDATKEEIVAAAQQLPHEELAELCLGVIDQLRAAEIKIKNLEIALQSNRHIGMAIGILMANERITEEQAFELLRAASQSQHRKLRELAEAVLFTGVIPQAEPLPASRSTQPQRSSFALSSTDAP
jgi:ABC-type uncharacterized transport system substrate-binding protein